MNDEKKNQIRHSIEYAKQELEELKANNPNGNYADLELMIEKMDRLLNDNTKDSIVKMLLRIVLFLSIAYVFCTICVATIFGFSISLLNDISPFRFYTILPLTSLVYFLGLRVMNFISNKTRKQPLISILIYGIIFVICAAFIDNLWLHICKALDKSFLLASVLFITTLLTDLFVVRKIYFKI